MSRTLHLLTLILIAAVLGVAAGCGGDDDGGGSAANGSTTTPESGAGGEGGEDEDAGDEESEGEGDPGNVAYQGAYELCAEGSVAEISALYGIDPPDAEAAAEAIAEQVGGGLSSEDFEQGRFGCLAAFDETG
jgi:hypothetical protein